MGWLKRSYVWKEALKKELMLDSIVREARLGGDGREAEKRRRYRERGLCVLVAC